MPRARSIQGELVCQFCKAGFYHKPSRVRQGKGKFCSRPCQRSWHNDPVLLRARFFADVRRPDGEGCHVWVGRINEWGYGVSRCGKRGPLLAHRLAWEFANGPIPAGAQVLHRCDNPPCVRPDHLFLGTNRDNVDDKIAKGRHPLGEDCHSAKLTEDVVREMRRLYAAKEKDTVELAEAHEVTHQTVNAIIHRRTWKHV